MIRRILARITSIDIIESGYVIENVATMRHARRWIGTDSDTITAKRVWFK